MKKLILFLCLILVPTFSLADPITRMHKAVIARMNTAAVAATFCSDKGAATICTDWDVAATPTDNDWDSEIDAGGDINLTAAGYGDPATQGITSRINDTGYGYLLQTQAADAADDYTEFEFSIDDITNWKSDGYIQIAAAYDRFDSQVQWTVILIDDDSDSAPDTLRLSGRVGTGACDTDDPADIAFVPVAGTFYKIKVRYKPGSGADGIANLWVDDGPEITQETQDSNDCNGVGGHRFGTKYHDAWDTTNTLTLKFDNFVSNATDF